MEPLTPSSQQVVDSSEAAAVRWSEFKQLYERYLDLYSRSLVERAEYTRLLGEKLQLEREEAKQRERQARFQRWLGWLFLIPLLCFAVAVVLAQLFKS